MKADSELPIEIAAVIDRAYRKHDMEFVKSRLRSTDRWLHIVQRIAGPRVVKDQTDFNYGRAFVYDVFLTTDQRAAIARTKQQEDMLRQLEQVYFVRVSISVLAAYYMLTFGEYRWAQQHVQNRFSAQSFTVDQERLAEQVRSEMGGVGFHELREQLAETIVPDIGTELRPRGTATVSDLIIGPY